MATEAEDFTLEAPPPMIATQKEMADARIPLAFRDSCAHLLIPLNKCREASWYLPWKCEDERHGYEKCQYDDYMRRFRNMQKLKRKQELEEKQAKQE
ncbi:hypothetical protein K493DRAFT_318268 [Basidiobolus meristosporus CBS 931.73]|uniref:NADH dehydrogenase [ubiquinone] 1 beta subcomplex subunit 7 n=1 Tax=Basidiobolus meristosporus CBS 931.73 TaxID=1314790 RepID=A0A1Y1XW71_9FUNG|nr:hypothetical protein K493DRAFT_318268 [Basidiobolus meristosporus CBS 931.73]|eukprot:ORX90007.1 hypothetical protein K493DRAFT_318268 [Basidiobolus meristosporus CBS 931.73]